MITDSSENEDRGDDPDQHGISTSFLGKQYVVVVMLEIISNFILTHR
jgi:hypothetical protein